MNSLWNIRDIMQLESTELHVLTSDEHDTLSFIDAFAASRRDSTAYVFGDAVNLDDFPFFRNSAQW